jgi:hypothetical protein
MSTTRRALTCSQLNMIHGPHMPQGRGAPNNMVPRTVAPTYAGTWSDPFCGMVCPMYPVEKFIICKVKQLYYSITSYFEMMHIW